MNLRIVQVVAHSFLPADDGGTLKTSTLASTLARRGELHCVSLDNDHRRPGPARPVQVLDLPLGGRCTFHSLVQFSHKQVLPRSLVGWARAARAGVFLPPAWLPTTPRCGAVLARVAGLRPDLVVANETLLAPFAAFAPARWRVVHTHNHESRLEIAHDPGDPGAAHRARAAQRLERIERILFPRVDQVWGVRQEDLDAYLDLGTGRDRLRLAPNVVPDTCFEPSPAPGPPGHAVYFGSLWYQPNRTALLRLLDLWPALRERVPGARLTVAGRGASPELEARARATEGVDLSGFVPDLRALLRDAAVVVIPLEDGGGTKIKTIEAMAAGRPILATPVAAEGLSLIDGDQVLIRPVGPTYLDALVDLIQAPDRWHPMGLRALEHARRHFSMAALGASVDEALDQLMHGGGLES